MLQRHFGSLPGLQPPALPPDARPSPIRPSWLKDLIMKEATTAPMAGTDAGTHFRDGRLADAIEAAGRAVKLQPGTAAPRVLLAELLLFTGNFARADTVLDAAEAADPS